MILFDKLPFLRIQLFPFRMPKWYYRYRWLFRRLGYFLTDMLIIVGCAALILAVWHYNFIF